MQKKYIYTLIIFFTFFININLFSQTSSVENFIKTGRDYYNLFQYDKAFDNFRTAINQDPENWEANYFAGLSLLKLKRVDEAEKYLSKAKSINPTDLDTQKALGSIYINLAKVAQNNGQTAKKIEYQLKACHAYPAATKIWESLFDTWISNDNYDSIIKESDFLYKNNQQLLDQGEDTSLQSALIICAKAYYAKKDYVKAETFLNHANKIRNTNDEIYSLKRQIKSIEETKINEILEKAEYEINKKEYEKAIGLLKEASKFSSSKSSELDSKIEELEKLVNLRKYIDELNSLIKKEDYENASIKAEEAIQLYPDNEDLSEKYTLIKNKIEEINDKIEAEERIKQQEEELKKDRDNKIANYKRNALKYEEQNNNEKALEELKKALALRKDPDIAQKINELDGKIKKEKERNNRYIKTFAEIQEFFKAKNYESATTQGELLLKDFPEHKEEIGVVLTEAYLELDKYEEAANASKPLEKNTEHKSLYNFAQGYAKYNKGDGDEAINYFKEVVNTDSKYKQKANKLIWLTRLKKCQIGVYLLLITIIMIIHPKISEYLKHSKAQRMAKTLEKIKETGSYEAYYNFLKQRYEKDDVSNRKLVMLLYSAALQKKGENELAYRIISEYLKKDAKSPLAKNIAGETAMAIGETSPIALEHIQGLLKINDNRKDAVEYLAKAYMTNKADHKLAQEYISKYISLYPNDNSAITYLADVYLGRLIYTEQSAKTFEKAIKVSPENAGYYNALKETYKAIGNQEKANNIQQILDEKFPDFSNSSSASADQLPYDPYSYPQNYEQQMTNPGSNQSSNSNNTLPESNQDYYNNSAQNNSQLDYNQQMQQQMYYQNPTTNTNKPINTKKSSAFPDYDSIGQDELSNIDPFANFDINNFNQNPNDLIQPNKDIVAQQQTTQTKTEPMIQGPKKNCPHCGAVNPANEYYCNSCGKPF